MKKLIKALFGIEATATAIRGKKSSGTEDISSAYKHWRASATRGDSSSTN